MKRFLSICEESLSDLTSSDEETVVAIRPKTRVANTSICADHLLAPPDCVLELENLDIHTGEIYGSAHICGRAVLGNVIVDKNLVCRSGLLLFGDLFVRGDLIITGGPLITDHDVVVRGRALFDHRPKGSGTLYCDDIDLC